MLILIADAFDKSLPGKLAVFGEVTDDTWLLKFLGKSSVKHSQIHQVSYSISALRN